MSDLVEALKRELRGYEMQGKTDRAAQVRAVLAGMGVVLESPRRSEPAPEVETAVDRKPREKRRL